MTSVGEDFPRQQARARELLKQYQSIGIQGSFGAMIIENALKNADEAAMSGDIVAIVRAYKELTELE